MNVSEWDDILRLSSTDARISTGERSALKARLDDAGLDERQRAVFRSRAFETAREVARDHGADGAPGLVSVVGVTTGLLVAGLGEGTLAGAGMGVYGLYLWRR